ncbi:ethylene-overproduction protein 1 [Rutidosis leptorrhynchoides]|uniref:ethylene-overproduction protein 1 n=1 Tax=Rutidosis leptorrhynchoides TaxID=125765 RepID=UPI003A99A158
MSISTIDHDNCSSSSCSSPRSAKILNLIRQFTSTMKTGGSKLKDRSKKPAQVHALTINSILSLPSETTSSTSSPLKSSHYGIPNLHLIEPLIVPFLNHVDFIESISNLYKRIINCSKKSELCCLYLEEYALFCVLGDSKLLRRSLQCAREHAVGVHAKVVLSAWLRFERREDELVGVSGLDCIGKVIECPKLALVDNVCEFSSSVFDCCQCVCENASEKVNSNVLSDNDCLDNVNVYDYEVVGFCIGNEVVRCIRRKIALLSSPLNTLLYGSFIESEKESIDFSRIGISVEAMRGVEVFSRTKKFIDFGSPSIVLEILSFSQKFCCEEMKSACEVYLASLVSNVDDALIFIEYGFEDNASLLVASCLQVLLREIPSSLNNPKVLSLFCTREAMEKLRMVGHASFLLYYFLTQVAMEERMTSANAVMLLERLIDCATEKWQKMLAFHQLGVLLLEREEYRDAQSCFEEAFDMGHVYSGTGIARTMYKQGKTYLARDLINKILSECNKPCGWMYQERSLYNLGSKKLLDLEQATKLDPTLTYPYKYRAISLVTENLVNEGIQEINKIIRFKVSPDCLELRAWFYLVLEDYQAAVRDIRAMLSLDPYYMMFHGKMRCDYLLEVLSKKVQQWSFADCWLQLYERWSCIDDIGSLAIIHQMMAHDPGKSLLRFRQSLLLLRLNCQKAAMRSLRLARNLSTTKHERLVYEGWILYDTGYREEALAKAEESILLQRSFEAYFLKAYTLADASLDQDSSSFVIQLLIDALKCPSDGLRKGQALNNLGSIYVDCGKLDLAADCYVNALDIKHTRAHQGLARVFCLKEERKNAYDEMTKLIEMAENSASAYEKRSEYCDRDNATSDLCRATQLDPLRTYPYRYRAAVLMDEQKESEAVEELTKAIAFKPELQMLHLRAAFYESMGDLNLALRDCEAALCLDPNHKETIELYNRIQKQAAEYNT